MKIRTWLAAAALAVILPAAARAQDRGTGYMGIVFSHDDDDAQVARVERVIVGSPADRAGIRAGDVVVRLNGRAASEDAVEDLREHLDRGDTVRLRVRRSGREEERVLVAAQRPSRVVYSGPDRGEFPGGVIVMPPGDERIVIRMDTLADHMDSLLTRMDSLRVHIGRRHGDSIVIRMDTVMRMWRDSLVHAWPRVSRDLGQQWERMQGDFGMLPYMFEFGPRSIAGAEFAEMNPGLARYFRTNEGLLVLQVGPQTPAARGGLQAGDVVVEANGRRVTEVGDLREAFARAGGGQEVRLSVVRDGARRQLSVRWDPAEVRTWRVRTEQERLRSRQDRTRTEQERVRARQERLRREQERARP